jgi:hypothetical protein
MDEQIRYDRTFNPTKWLDRKKKELGMRAAYWLLGMAESKDPFKVGSKGDFEKAEWFRRMYEQFGYYGVHLRRMHYRMANNKPAPPLLWDGKTPYLNIDLHWEKLQEASKIARILRLVDAAAFKEKYNKARPTIHQRGSLPLLGEEENQDPDYWFTPPEFGGALPTSTGAGWGPKFTRGLPFNYFPVEQGVTGMDYDPSLQPNLIEIWSETEFDSFHRIANRYHINYVPLQGYASLTAIKTMLRRLKDTGKPGRILYISDYDPAGFAMPVSFARHCQFATWELEEIAAEIAPEIKVDNVAVTGEQVEKFDLPRMPIKETDLRRAMWELEHGEGAVEVEGMDAAVPGELERILEERIEDLLDLDLEDKVGREREEAENRVNTAIREVLEDHREDFEEIHRRAGELRERYQKLYDALWAEVGPRYWKLERRFNREMRSPREDLQRVEGEVRSDLEDMEVELPELPEGDAEEDQDRVWLFDSEREFVEQTNYFRRLKGEEVYGE